MIKRTEEFVTRCCVNAVQTAYAVPVRNDMAAIGRNTRSGLNIVITRSMMSRNFGPSRESRIFDVPTR